MPEETRSSDQEFLGEIRAFLAHALTPDLRDAGRRTIGVHSDIDACRMWHRRLFEQGWIAPAWPKAWGGAGWTARQRFVFERECAAHDAPVLFAGGIRSLGPLLIEQGTDAQRRRYLPAILSGADLWCQGFSEPAAGSDLAAVQSRAVRDGEHYIVTGSKIWTTGAHHANRMFALLRTEHCARKQDGLTFVLMDMHSPGVSVSPILDLTGAHEFNQVFFEEVRVPAENRVGDEGDGWSVAKRLMQLARSNNTPSALVRRTLNSACRAAVEAGVARDPAIARKITTLEIELEAYAQIELASLPGGAIGPERDYAASMLKIIGTELHQKVTALSLEISAPHGACEQTGVGPQGAVAAKYFATRAATIYSGTSETHRNIIAKHFR